MRIQFVLNTLILTGGVRVVFEHARRLRARGHEVVLLAPRPRLLPRHRLSSGAIKAHLYEQWSGTVPDGLRSYGLLEAVERFDPRRPESAPGADVLVATAWETAEWVAAMPARAGRPYYLVQQYEAWSEDIRDRVDRTWTLPLRKIVIAGWLERLAAERFGERVCARIPNGVDVERFVPAPRSVGGSLRLGMLYDIAPWKGVDDGIAALWQVYHSRSDVSFVLFGRFRMRHRLPPGARYIRDPRQHELPGIYQSADVFINSSRSEGFSLVILEAMACGCALVATAVGEVPEMGRPGIDYLMVPPRDPAALAREALALLADPSRRDAVVAAGLSLARRYTWERATDLLEQALAEG